MRKRKEEKKERGKEGGRERQREREIEREGGREKGREEEIEIQTQTEPGRQWVCVKEKQEREKGGGREGASGKASLGKENLSSTPALFSYKVSVSINANSFILPIISVICCISEN